MPLNADYISKLVPIYQYHALQKDGGWRFNYSTNDNFGQGWIYDGVAFQAFNEQQGGSVPIYQYHFPQEDGSGGWRYYFSTNGNFGQGWIYDGVAFYAFDGNRPGSIAIYQYHATQSDGWRYYFSTDPDFGHGWTRDDIAFYAPINAQPAPALTPSQGAFHMAYLSSYAYENDNSLADIFRDGLKLRDVTWGRPSFLEDSDTSTQCIVTTEINGSSIAVAFRGSEWYGIAEILKGVARVAPKDEKELLYYVALYFADTGSLVGKLFRAALNENSWLQDWYISDAANIAYADWPANQEGSKVGYGFLRAWKAIKNQVENAISQAIAAQGTSAELFITGHSLGAAIAQLAAPDIFADIVLPARRSGKAVKLSLFAYAAPVVGNARFVNYFNSIAKDFSGAIQIYRDPTDEIGTVNGFLMSERFSDPYSDLEDYAYSTRHGQGHAVTNYITLLDPRSEALGSLARRQTSTGPQLRGAIGPEDLITSLTIRTITGRIYDPDLLQPPPPTELALVVALDESWAGGLRLPFGVSDQVAPFYLPGQIDTFRIALPNDRSLTVSQLQRCALELIQSDNATPEASLNRKPLVLGGLEVVVNRSVVESDFDLGLALSPLNPRFLFTIQTPRLLIVGSVWQVTDDTSKQPLLVASRWGMNPVFGQGVISGRCKSDQYKDSSYGYVEIFTVSSASASAETPWVVGGRVVVTDEAGNQPRQELLWWGQRSNREEPLFECYCYSGIYGHSYSYITVFLMDSREASLSAPAIVGGRYRVTNDDSSKAWIETSSWGERTQNETILCHGYCYSTQYGGDSYYYASVFTRDPVQSGVAPPAVYKVTVTDIHCNITQESQVGGGQFGSYKDEIYLKLNGVKVWPPNERYKSIANGQTFPIGQSGSVSVQVAANWELWDADDISSDDLLYIYSITTSVQLYDPGANSYVFLSQAIPGKVYRYYGRKVDQNASYWLAITVSA